MFLLPPSSSCIKLNFVLTWDASVSMPISPFYLLSFNFLYIFFLLKSFIFRSLEPLYLRSALYLQQWTLYLFLDKFINCHHRMSSTNKLYRIGVKCWQKASRKYNLIDKYKCTCPKSKVDSEEKNCAVWPIWVTKKKLFTDRVDANSIFKCKQFA